MTQSTPNRPSDTEAAHAAGAGTSDGEARVDGSFARDVDNAERRPHTGDPSIHGRNGEPTAGAAVADRLPEEAVAESGDDVAAGGSGTGR